MAVPQFSTSDHDSVLDFVNTVVAGNGELTDRFCTDADVTLWLENTKLCNKGYTLSTEQGMLVSEARSLREIIRELLEQRKMGHQIDIRKLNAALAVGSYRIELATDCEGGLVTRRRYSSDTAAQLLVPVAMAAADLLARGDFRLIRKCEGENCPLWFCDRTKAHRRRWCDMALCGNRKKVAEFRTRAKKSQRSAS